MKSYTTYFLMDIDTVTGYVIEKLDMFTEGDKLHAEEIGDGNLNYVFRVKSSDKSVIVKQAGTTARISEDFKLSTDRIRIESEALSIQGGFAEALVPTVYLYDPIMGCCIMEDLGQFSIMRGELIEGKIFPHFTDHITTFLAETLMRTSDVILPHQEKKKVQSTFTNPELCEITEDLVYTEPFLNHFNRNILTAGNESWMQEALMEEQLHIEAAKLKFDFMTRGQALLHGDLHTGSIFVTEQETKVIDPEFAFYGPMGYDIGNIIANLIFSYTRSEVLKVNEQSEWLVQTISSIVDGFLEKAKVIWNSDVLDPMAKQDPFREWYLNSVIIDTAGVAGLELIRRIVGLAKVADITSLEHSERIIAERLCIAIAKRLIFEREQISSGNDFIEIIKSTLDIMKEESR